MPDDTLYNVSYQLVTETGNYIGSNLTSATEYNISELEPITRYRIRILSENGVSYFDMRPGILSTRSVEIVCTTGEGRK